LKRTDVETSGDLAYVIGEFAILVPIEGGKPANVAGTYLSVWKRGEDSVWRVKVDAWVGKGE
jgi:ketosteroid isomerase-like protein